MDGFEGGELDDLEDIDTALSNKNKTAVKGRPKANDDEFDGLWGNKQPKGAGLLN